MKIKQLSYVQAIALGFLTVIAAGTILLMLPVSSRSGEATGFVTALFTSVSASCVTGLVLVDTATYWSGFGQAIVLLLIQIGGLGFMTIATLFSRLLRRRMSLRERGVMAESINTVRVGRILEITTTIGLGTLIFEGTGALLLAIRFIPEFGLGQGIWYSVFHSVSAFCNAGFDLMGVKAPFSSLVSYSDDALVCVTIMLLIILGGLGFLVWDDMRQKGLHWRRYDLQTKLVLVMTLALILGGALLFFLIERNRMNADMPLGEQILVSFFSAVTPRTAGFNSVDTAALSDASKLLTVILMFIGGSPGSTAGGIKTTSVAVVLVFLFSGIRGRRGAYVFGRRIPDDTMKRTGMIVSTNLILALCGALVLCGTQSLPLSDVLIETFSAIGTVGMSTGITRELTNFSALIVALLMYCGRVGSVSFAMALLERRSDPPVTYPTEQVTVG